MLRFSFFLFFLIFFNSKAQFICENAFVQDTMSIPETDIVLEGSYVETPLKDLSVIRLFKTLDEKYYLRMIVKKNFYFNKVGVLEIRSGSKSIYYKNNKQYKLNKTTGMFFTEVQKNYLSTIKDDGITSLYFAEAETEFTRGDASQIKKMAKCFYDAIN
jgi:hypothetical protein